MLDSFLWQSLGAAFFIGLISLVGAITFVLKKGLINKISMFLLAFSTGALIGGAFFHLLPEAIELDDSLSPFLYLVIGIIVFFALEKYLKWHHCHNETGECKVHTFTYMSLVGDGFHNFLDGLIIVSAFSVSTEIGLVAVVAVAAHEIPQELGDFGVLIHGGFSKLKALFWNFISAMTALLGVLVGYSMINYFDNITALLLPFAAGGFIYVAMSDLVPELHKETRLKKSIINFSIFGLGISFMLLLRYYFGH